MKKIFLTVLTMLCVVFMSVALFAACNPSDNPPDGPDNPGPNTGTTKHQVTVKCGENGTYKLDKEDGKYDDGTTVKLTVTPNNGYEIESVMDGYYDITREVLTAGDKNITDPGERTYEFTIYSDKTFDIKFRTEGGWSTGTFTVSISDYDDTYGSVVYSPVKDYYEKGEEITVTATLKNGSNKGIKANKLRVGKESIAEELNLSKEGTITKTIAINENTLIDVMFDDWTVITKVDINNIADFEKYYDAENLIVDCYTPWCQYCPPISTALSKFAPYGLCKIVQINCDINNDHYIDQEFASSEIATELMSSITGFPCVIFYRDGIEMSYYWCTKCQDPQGLVPGVERPETCETCGQHTMEEAFVFYCNNCGNNWVHVKSMTTACYKCRSSNISILSKAYRWRGCPGVFQQGTEAQQMQYICTTIGLDVALLGA